MNTFRIVPFVVVLGMLAESGTTASATTGSTGGDRRFAAADFDGAERAYRSCLRDDRQKAASELGLARIALYRNELDDAERYANAFAADEPNDSRGARLLETIAERRDDGPAGRVELAGAEVDVPIAIDALPSVAAIVNGRRARLVLDTGAPGLTLGSAFAGSLGLATRAGGVGVFAGGLRGTVRRGRVDRLAVGGASLRSIPITVTEQMPPGIDGVLGTMVLYRFLVTIDYVHHRLVLRPKTASTTFERSARRRGATIVPMLLVPDHFIFTRARVDGAPPALFNVDTGGPGIGVDLTEAALRAARIVPDRSRPVPFVGGGGATTMFPFTADVTLGNRTIRRVAGVFFPRGNRYGIFPFRVAGALSQSTFEHGALSFDFSAMELVFETARP